MAKKILIIGGFFLLFSVVLFVLYAAHPAALSIPAYGKLKFHDIPVLHSDNPPISLTLVTYNIGYASGAKNNTEDKPTQKEVIQNLDAMIDQLKKTKPDILGLQEVDFQADRTYGINELEYLAHGLGLPYAAYAITWNKNYLPWPYWPPSAHFGKIVSGQAVLSRYPIEDDEVFYFDKPAANPFWYNLFYLDRVVQKITVDLKEKNITVWNLHLEAFDEKTRASQVGELLSRIKGESKNSVFVLGDFNQLITLSNLQNAEKEPYFSTFPSWKPDSKIDHIFYRNPVRLKKVFTLPQLLASDHLPVIAEFQIP